MSLYSYDEELMLTPCDKYIAEEHFNDCLTEEEHYPSHKFGDVSTSDIDIWIISQIAELDKDSDIATF